MEFTHTINGKAETSDRAFDVINPATAQPFAKCPDASREQLDRAVAAARRAFDPWRKLSFADRRKLIADFAHGLAARIDEIGPVLTREQGKPLGQAKWEIGGGVHELEAMCAIDFKPEQLIRNDGKHKVELVYHPLGVVGAITPWNFPIILAAHKIAHGLYAGNTMVLKPSPYTPLATLLMGEVARDTLPPGVLNTIAGGNDLGQWITEHAGIDRISFTGSVATGKRVMASAAGTLKRVTLELGGNDPAIVLEDANLDEITPNVGRWPDTAADPLGRYLATLRRVAALAPAVVYPGHGPVIHAASDRAAEIAGHHDERLDAAAAALAEGAESAYDAAQLIWRDEPLGFHEQRFALVEAISHLERLAATGRAVEHRPARWRPPG